MSWLHPTDKHLLFTKNDKEDPRLGECVQILNKDELSNFTDHEFDCAILGYPDDEGIALNGGRPGAQVAPREIRTYLYKMTPHLNCSSLPKILDLGDLTDKEKALQERHAQGREIIKQLSSNNKKWISLGGGHDYGYSDAAGFLDAFKNQAVLLNFDAHLDVRPAANFNSGTPFYRVLTEFSKQVDFAEIGIQNQCNSRTHLNWAKSQGANIFTLDDVNEQGLLNILKNYLHDKKNKKIFLSVDIDAFTSNEAPGCSQSWTTGLVAKEFLDCLQWIIREFDVRGLGIYEVSPPLDQDNRTSKLAALIAYNFIFAQKSKG